MAKTNIDTVVLKADKLHFTFRVLSSGRYQLLFKSKDGSLTGRGYQGNLDECLAYLLGWEERHSYELATPR